MWRTIKWWLWFGALNFLIFLVFNQVLSIFIQKDEEELALGIQAVILGGLYSGRYLANLWTHLEARAQNQLILGICALMIFIIFLLAVTFSHLISHFQPSTFIFFCIVFFFLWINIGVLAKLIEHQINNKIKVAELNAANSKTELQLLQSQLSPHFLFNTLNNLYGLSLTEHEKIPGLLLKLSELLRYSVYNTHELYVALRDEIAYLNNYIAFEKIRLGGRLKLSCDIETVENKSLKIAPMLLIVFVENAFKHAKNTQDEEIFIDISLKVWENSVLFSVKNSHFKSNPNTELVEDSSGFGLLSVRKRLALLYPKTHHLNISETPREYLVKLMLELK